MNAEETGLIAALLAGDRDAIAKVRAWIAFELARYKGRLGGELEDLEQDIVLELMEALGEGRFRGESRLETYARSHARFKCIDRLRALGRRQMVELDDNMADQGRVSPLDSLAEREAGVVARRVVEALPEPCRELWGMIAKGLSYKEMSAATGVAEGALRVRAFRCRQRALEARLRLLGEEGM